jgi:hypothetical protein
VFFVNVPAFGYLVVAAPLLGFDAIVPFFFLKEARQKELLRAEDMRRRQGHSLLLHSLREYSATDMVGARVLHDAAALVQSGHGPADKDAVLAVKRLRLEVDTMTASSSRAYIVHAAAILLPHISENASSLLPVEVLRKMLLRRADFLSADDLEIRREGIPALSDDEVREAIIERGLVIQEDNADELRLRLGAWLEMSKPLEYNTLSPSLVPVLVALSTPQYIVNWPK